MKNTHAHTRTHTHTDTHTHTHTRAHVPLHCSTELFVRFFQLLSILEPGEPADSSPLFEASLLKAPTCLPAYTRLSSSSGVLRGAVTDPFIHRISRNRCHRAGRTYLPTGADTVESLMHSGKIAFNKLLHHREPRGQSIAFECEGNYL